MYRNAFSVYMLVMSNDSLLHLSALQPDPFDSVFFLFVRLQNAKTFYLVPQVP